jgi:hypothetical protein
MVFQPLLSFARTVAVVPFDEIPVVPRGLFDLFLQAIRNITHQIVRIVRVRPGILLLAHTASAVNSLANQVWDAGEIGDEIAFIAWLLIYHYPDLECVKLLFSDT